MILYLVSNPFLGNVERFKTIDEAKNRYLEICKNIILINGPKISRATHLDPDNVNNVPIEHLKGREPLGDIMQKSFYKWLDISLKEFSDDDIVESTAGHSLPEELAFYEALEKEKTEIFITERSRYLDFVVSDPLGVGISSENINATIDSIQLEILNAKEHLQNIIQNKNMLAVNLNRTPNVTTITAAEVSSVNKI